jgi:cyanophycinase
MYNCKGILIKLNKRKMKKVVLMLIMALVLIVYPASNSTVSGQSVHVAPKLFIGGGALPEEMYKEFLKLTGPDAKLVVIPTASSRDINVEEVQKLWRSRGFQQISILHTKDRKVASSTEFTEPLRKATAVWFNGGSQQRISDAYIGTSVEKELYQLLKRGGVIGGSSAGAAIQSKIMITGGGKQPKFSIGFELFPGAILDQHFLKRNRLSRLIKAIHTNPKLIGFGIDEGTAIVVRDNEYSVVGESYVIRIELVEGEVKIDAFKNGDKIPLANNQKN